MMEKKRLKLMKKSEIHLSEDDAHDSNSSDSKYQKEMNQESKERVKGRRGYKRCKNPLCNQELHIHSKECPKCKFTEQFSNKDQLGQKSKENVLEFARKLINIHPDQKVPKKYLDSIYVFKKTLLQKDQSNFDRSFLMPLMTEMQSRIFGDMAINKQQLTELHNGKKLIQDKILPKLPWIVQVEDVNGEYQQTISLSQFVSLPEASRWQLFLANYGCPIQAVQFAHRSIKNDPSQYLAISLQTNAYDQENQRIQFQNIKDFNYQKLHMPGVQYEGRGVLGIIKIPFDEVTNQFSEPKLQYYLSFNNGCILKLKWCPKFSNSQLEVGLLGMVTSMGLIDIVSVPIQKGDEVKFYQGQVAQTVQIKNQLITALDWVVSKENDIIAVGDANGTVYVLKLGLELHAQGYLVLNIIQSLHLSEITDVQFYPHNDSSTLLLATTSYDGTLKILQPLQSSDPIVDINLSSKGILSINWDYGGKYIQVIRDESTSRAMIVSFYAVEKGPKGHEAGYDLSDKIEQRYLGSLCGSANDLTVASSQHFNQSMTFFTNLTGKTYMTSTESIRKLAIKKEKKQTTNALMVLNINVESINPVLLQINQPVGSDAAKKEATLIQPNAMSCFRELHVCPSDIKNVPNSQKSNLETFTVQASLSGLLVINKVNYQI